MRVLDLNPRQRTLAADKLFDAGNVAAGGMIFGQFLADRPFSVLLAVTGLGIWLTFFIVSVLLEGRSRP
jgi:hypothetical protein